jgi:hypothetical protein
MNTIKEILKEALKEGNHFTDDLDNKTRESWYELAIPYRIAFLEMAYSTQVKMHGNLAEISAHISKIKDIDERIKYGKLCVVDEIASFKATKGKYEGSEVKLFSFATKYCSFGNSAVFPMYDSLALRGIRYLKRNLKLKFDKTGDFKNAKDWNDVVTSFMVQCDLKDKHLLCIDSLLTYVGNNFKKKNWF